jgi:hypothetical protein
MNVLRGRVFFYLIEKHEDAQIVAPVFSVSTSIKCAYNGCVTMVDHCMHSYACMLYL